MKVEDYMLRDTTHAADLHMRCSGVPPLVRVTLLRRAQPRHITPSRHIELSSRH